MSPISPEVRKARERFTKEAEEVLRLFKGKVEATTSPGTVYHYTDDVGLSGILETGKLRLSNLFKLNDPSELRHGLSIASDILKARALQEPLAKLSADFHSYLGTELQSTGHYFVCSFSSDGNDLGQWRAYADNGRGYALGFDLKALEKAFANPDENSPPLTWTFPITYSDSTLKDIHSKIIEKALAACPGQQNATTQYMAGLPFHLALHTLEAATFFKHEAYKNEKEYRFLEIFPQNSPPKVKQRTRRYSFVEYRELDWKSVTPEALREIVVGPANWEVAHAFAESCLGQFGFDMNKVSLVPSGVPYRVP